MSYDQAMKWGKKHRKGITKAYFGFACASTPWPAAVCPDCGNAYMSENHKQFCHNPEYHNTTTLRAFADARDAIAKATGKDGPQ